MLAIYKNNLNQQSVMSLTSLPDRLFEYLVPVYKIVVNNNNNYSNYAEHL